MRVAVVGTGYVGLVSGACFASKGHDVTCVDVDPARVDAINEARMPIYEDGLLELLRKHVPHSLRATGDLARAVADADVVMLAVGTPFDGERIDLSQVRQAAREVGEALGGSDRYRLIVVKSTVLPGTTDRVVRPLLEEASGRVAGADCGVAMNPEFLREGQAVADFMNPDRVVMGGLDERSWEVQEELYRGFACPDMVRTSNTTAEMIKYTSNALLATMISFANEVGNLCGATAGVDVTEVMRAVHLDKRLSPLLPSGERVTPGFTTYLMAGCGFGGSCFPKDVNSLIAFGDDNGSPMALLGAAMAVNAAQPGKLVDLVRRHVASLAGVPITVLGLAFKPGTSDIRETPAVPVVRALRAAGARLRVYDPAAQTEAAAVLGSRGIDYAASLADALDGAAVVVVLTSWPEFADLPERLAGLAEPPLVVDGRRMFDKGRFARYDGIGLGPSAASST